MMNFNYIPKAAGRNWQLVVACLFAFLLAFAVIRISHATGATSIESTYKQAKAYHQKVANSKSLASERQNWLTSIRNFRSIYQNNESHWLSPSCLFMMSRVYRDMYGHFQNPLDLGEAIAYYEDVVSMYPKNRLADDALYEIANIYLNDKGDPGRAAKLYKRLVKRYPEGDMASAATLSLRKLGATEPTAPPILTSGGVKTRANGKKQPKLTATNDPPTVKAELKPIRFWSNKNYTRVVIETTAQIKYKENLLKKTNNAPRRLYIDLENCRIAPELQDPIPINDGLLKRVRSGQHSPTTTRVVLDTQSLSDYKIFSLPNPFRIVIDVMGQKSGEVVAETTPVIDTNQSKTRTSSEHASKKENPATGKRPPEDSRTATVKKAAGTKDYSPKTSLRATAKIPVEAPDTGVVPGPNPSATHRRA